MASQVTQVQGNDEREEVMDYQYGFVSGELVMVLVRIVANYMFGGRYAEPPVICVEVGVQVDLVAYDEELVDDLTTRLLKPEENCKMWVHRAQHAHVDYVKWRGSRRC